VEAQQIDEEIIARGIEEKFYRNIEEKKRIYTGRVTRGIIYNHTCQLATLFGSALVPLLLTIPSVPTVVPTVISGIVLVASALTAYYKFSDRVRHLQRTLDMMVQEELWKDLRGGPYEGMDRHAALALFVERSTKIVQQQNAYSYSYAENNKNLPTKETSALTGAL
jgi:hypothetical protein